MSAALRLDLDRNTAPAPLETRRRSRRRLTEDPVVGHPLEPLGHRDRDLEPSQVYAEAEMLAAAEREQSLDGTVPDELVGVAVFALVTAGRGQQCDDPLPRPNRGVGDGEWP